jgi:hypothetical protein
LPSGCGNMPFALSFSRQTVRFGKVAAASACTRGLSGLPEYHGSSLSLCKHMKVVSLHPMRLVERANEQTRLPRWQKASFRPRVLVDSSPTIQRCSNASLPFRPRARLIYMLRLHIGRGLIWFNEVQRTPRRWIQGGPSGMDRQHVKADQRVNEKGCEQLERRA